MKCLSIEMDGGICVLMKGNTKREKRERKERRREIERGRRRKRREREREEKKKGEREERRGKEEDRRDWLDIDWAAFRQHPPIDIGRRLLWDMESGFGISSVSAQSLMHCEILWAVMYIVLLFYKWVRVSVYVECVNALEIIISSCLISFISNSKISYFSEISRSWCSDWINHVLMGTQREYKNSNECNLYKWKLSKSISFSHSYGSSYNAKVHGYADKKSFDSNSRLRWHVCTAIRS